jgi:hypothetical protein
LTPDDAGLVRGSVNRAEPADGPCVRAKQRLLHEAHEIVARRGDAHQAHAAYLREMHGVVAPCLIVGEGAIQEGYLLRCLSLPATGDTIAPLEYEISSMGTTWWCV